MIMISTPIVPDNVILVKKKMSLHNVFFSHSFSKELFSHILYIFLNTYKMFRYITYFETDKVLICPFIITIGLSNCKTKFYGSEAKERIHSL
jgi:hypothetical protein